MSETDTLYYGPATTSNLTLEFTATDHVDNTTSEEQTFGTASLTKYYLFGGQRVAMRVGTAVYYLHGDHLGSTSLTTDATGGLVSQARFTPFGEVAWDGGTVAPTDFGFTGQRADGSIKLLDYGARWYDARLGRFISADSIIPGAGNPMAWDRFSYGLNNPSRYVDPTGHIACEDLGTEDCGENGEYTNDDFGGPTNANGALRAIAESLLRMFGGKNDLEALARIVEAADHLYAPGDTYGFLNGINLVIAGSELAKGFLSAGQYALNALQGQNGGMCNSVGADPTNGCGNALAFNDEGFHRDFQDHHNQLFHFWSAFVSATYSPFLGWLVTGDGNILHETWDPNHQRSWQDFHLTKAGIQLGFFFAFGYYSRSDMGAIFRVMLGPNGPGSSGRVARDTRIIGPLDGPNILR